jgi:RNA polymerase sigma-70 factor (ECF subfamily)
MKQELAETTAKARPELALRVASTSNERNNEAGAAEKSRSRGRQSISSVDLRLSEVERGPDEAELITRVLKGDRDAFRPLVEAYEPAVFGLCRKLVYGREAEAEDLAQETFLRAFTRLEELKDRDRFAPWLYQIARSLCRDWSRRASAERRALERKIHLKRWEEAGREADDDVGFALSNLPDEERKALELKYFEGLSYREIARRMSLSFSQVDHLIREARQRLGRRMTVKRIQRERYL